MFHEADCVTATGSDETLEKIRKLAGQNAAYAADERRRARQREDELQIWKVTVGEKTWRRWVKDHFVAALLAGMTGAAAGGAVAGWLLRALWNG